MQKITVLIFILFAVSLSASEILTINLTSGESVEIALDEISQITFGATATNEDVVDFINSLPFDLKKNYPNPFNPETTIDFETFSEGKVTLEIFNSKGQLVKTLCNKTFPQGQHSIIWEGKDESGNKVASGIFFYSLSMNSQQKIKKMILLK